MMRLMVLLSIFTLAGCASIEPVPYMEYAHEKAAFPAEEQVTLFITEAESLRVNYRAHANYEKVALEGLGVDKAEIGWVGIFFSVIPEFFVGVILANNWTLNSQQKSRQDEADKVLEPLLDTIKDFYNAELLSAALSEIKHDGFINKKAGTANWVIESTPVFFMVESEHNLLLLNSIKLYANGQKEKVLYSNLIEVLSLPEQKQNAKLKKTSIALFSHSIELALADIKHRLEGSYAEQEQTLNYFFAGKKRYERGSLISTSCERILIRTLRGWVKSAPRSKLGPQVCDKVATM